MIADAAVRTAEVPGGMAQLRRARHRAVRQDGFADDPHWHAAVAELEEDAGRRLDSARRSLRPTISEPRVPRPSEIAAPGPSPDLRQDLDRLVVDVR